MTEDTLSKGDAVTDDYTTLIDDCLRELDSLEELADTDWAEDFDGDDDITTVDDRSWFDEMPTTEWHRPRTASPMLSIESDGPPGWLDAAKLRR